MSQKITTIIYTYILKNNCACPRCRQNIVVFSSQESGGVHILPVTSILSLAVQCSPPPLKDTHISSSRSARCPARPLAGPHQSQSCTGPASTRPRCLRPNSHLLPFQTSLCEASPCAEAPPPGCRSQSAAWCHCYRKGRGYSRKSP